MTNDPDHQRRAYRADYNDPGHHQSYARASNDQVGSNSHRLHRCCHIDDNRRRRHSRRQQQLAKQQCGAELRVAALQTYPTPTRTPPAYDFEPAACRRKSFELATAYIFYLACTVTFCAIRFGERAMGYASELIESRARPTLDT